MPDELSVPWMPAYLEARGREGRLLPDDLVARLPRLPSGHPLAGEWLIREQSARRLLGRLAAMRRPLSIVDAGCGNGWLAAAMADLPGATVVAIDANAVELGQAERLFGRHANLAFVEVDLEAMPRPDDAVDVVVLASVIQYVIDLDGLLRRLRRWLAPGGELHVIDSPIYEPEQLPGARDRSRSYYSALGVPEMADAYRHHTWAELEPFDPIVIQRPEPSARRLLRRLSGRVDSPFPWLVIGPEDNG